MASFSGGGTERTTDRLEAFSDAVLAIAITLPVVELHAPRSDDGDLAAGYLKLRPDYAAYGLSVILIGLYWAHSHFTGKLLRKTDHGYNLLTVGFLAAVSITPFPARPLLEHLASDAESKTAAIVYLGVAAAPATWWFLRWMYATARSLTDPRLADAYLNRITVKYGVTAAAYWAAFALAFWDWGVGLITAGIVTLTYLVPPARPVFKPDVQSTTVSEIADKKLRLTHHGAYPDQGPTRHGPWPGRCGKPRRPETGRPCHVGNAAAVGSSGMSVSEGAPAVVRCRH